MYRNATLREFNEHFDSLLPDQESLIVQLCDHIFRSGFVFEDASETEVEAGGWVIRDFFDQEADVLRVLVPRDRFVNFSEYVKKFDWPTELLQKKLSQRILIAFNQLAKGSHHNFNIRYNISQGLRQNDTHPLYDLLLYIETYFTLVLGGGAPEPGDLREQLDFSKTNYRIEDLMRMRSQIQERFEGRELVKSFLKHIAKKRGVSVKSLEHAEMKKERQNPPIKFFRSSPLTSPTKKLTVADVSEKSKSKENPYVSYKLKINSVPTVNQDELLEIPLELDLVPDKTEVADEAGTTGKNTIGNKDEEVFSADVSEKSETLPDEDDEDGNAGKLEEIVSEENVFHPSFSVAELLNNVDEDEEIEENDSGLQQVDSEESDVVFGGKEITQASMEKFVHQYPESTLRYLLRRNLDGRPLPTEIVAVHSNWEDRGLLRERLKKYILKLMEWQKVPDMPALDLLQNLRDHLYEVSHKDKI